MTAANEIRFVGGKPWEPALVEVLDELRIPHMGASVFLDPADIGPAVAGVDTLAVARRVFAQAVFRAMDLPESDAPACITHAESPPRVSGVTLYALPAALKQMLARDAQAAASA